MIATRPDLLDLRDLAPDWRVRRDPEGLPVIPGRRGNVSAHDGETLCVYVRGARSLAALLRALPAGWARHQVGDDEANLLAPLADLARAAAVVKAYRRRRLSPERRAAAVDRLQKAREVCVARRSRAHNDDSTP